MALEVEDGSGKTNADSYVSVADYRAYAANRGIEAVEEFADSECEQHLRVAFDFVNNYGAWKSSPKVNLQSGEFPRIDLSDGMGRVFSDVVPQRVVSAQCEAAILHGGGVDLNVVAERGGGIASEAVGPISTSYFQGSKPETYFQAIDSFLKPFLRDPNCPRKPLPSFNDYEADPIFSVGMDDNPGQV